MMRRYVGRHRAPQPPAPARPVAPLAVPLCDVEVECEGLFVVLRHLGDGRTTDDAWKLGTIDAGDLLTASACAS
jgi:hypothetical protein